jgi:hypothetical protein
MTRSLTRIALLVAVLCTAASLGQDNAPPTPAPAARPPPAATPPPAAGQQADGAAAAPPAAQRPTVEDDEFIPTEELAPDAAVTFPVDI